MSDNPGVKAEFPVIVDIPTLPVTTNSDPNIAAITMSNPETQSQEAPSPDVIFAHSGSMENATELVPQQQQLEQQQPTEIDHSAVTPQSQQQALPNLQPTPTQETLQEFAMQLQAQAQGVPHQGDSGQQEDLNREESSGIDPGTPPGGVNNRNKSYRTVAPLPVTAVQTMTTPIPQTPLIMVLPPQTLPQPGGAGQQPQYFLQLAQPQQPGQQQQQQTAQQQPLQAAFSLPIQFALPGQNQSTTMMAPHPFFTFAGQQGGQAIQIQLAPGANGAAIPINAGALGDGRPGTLPLPALRFAQHDGKGRSAQNALYPCPHPGCDKSFYRKQNLQSHARCHSGENFDVFVHA